MKISRFQFITNYQSKVSHFDQVVQAVKGGADWIQFRPKDMPWNEILKEGKRIGTLCRKHGVAFIMNDSVAAAMELNAVGVHLGKTDMQPREARKIMGREKIIGGTANTIEDIVALTTQNVDYIGLGPFRFTKTKKNLSPVLGHAGYNEILNEMNRRSITVPVVAIGGIGKDDVITLMDSKLHGIALSSVISEADDIAQQTAMIKQILDAQ